MAKHCCDQMRKQLDNKCTEHSSPYECPDCLVNYSPVFNEYGIIVHDGGSSSITIEFCPWCGAQLPESLRDRWFNELESLGFDSPFAQDIPEKYKTNEWYSI
jgi:hypothetical protein